MLARFSPYLAVLGAVTLGCSGPATNPKAAVYKEPPRVPHEDDEVVKGCLREFPKEGHLGGGIDPQRAWAICMEQSGRLQGLCDPAGMMGLSAAVCIARGKGLPMADQWRARLEFAPVPSPSVLWRLALLDESAHMMVDVHSGQVWHDRPRAKDSLAPSQTVQPTPGDQ